MANPQNLQPPFAKNDGDKKDPRINRKGRKVSNFKQLRKLAQDVGNEVISEEEGITRILAMLRVMSSSRNPADRMGFLAYMVGKPKDEVDVTSGGMSWVDIVKALKSKTDE